MPHCSYLIIVWALKKHWMWSHRANRSKMGSDKTSELNAQMGWCSFAFLKLTKGSFEDRISVLTGAAFRCYDVHSILISVVKLSKNNPREYDSLDIATEATCLMGSEWKMGRVPVSLLVICSSDNLNKRSQFRYYFLLRTSLNMKLQDWSFNKFLPDVLTTVTLFFPMKLWNHRCCGFNALKVSHHLDYIMIFLNLLTTITPSFDSCSSRVYCTKTMMQNCVRYAFICLFRTKRDVIPNYWKKTYLEKKLFVSIMHIYFIITQYFCLIMINDDEQEYYPRFLCLLYTLINCAVKTWFPVTWIHRAMNVQPCIKNSYKDFASKTFVLDQAKRRTDNCVL